MWPTAESRIPQGRIYLTVENYKMTDFSGFPLLHPGPIFHSQSTSCAARKLGNFFFAKTPANGISLWLVHLNKAAGKISQEKPRRSRGMLCQAVGAGGLACPMSTKPSLRFQTRRSTLQDQVGESGFLILLSSCDRSHPGEPPRPTSGVLGNAMAMSALIWFTTWGTVALHGRRC